MKILITGGTGFVGSCLSIHLLQKGWKVTALGRSEQSRLEGQPGYRLISCDTTKPGDWQNEIVESDVIINLAGRSIFTLWTDKSRQDIEQSRLLTTENVVNAIPEGKHPVLLSTSAAGYYGDRSDEVLTEAASPGNDYLANLCVKWEKAALKAKNKGCRVATMRFGVVLGKGGALEKMLPSFKFYLGGSIGKGNHWFPWIHIEDLANAVEQLIINDQASGPFNFSSPVPVHSREFTDILASVLKRPALIPIPEFVLRTVLGDLGNALLSSQHLVPEKLNQLGFSFRFPTINEALENLVF